MSAPTPAELDAKADDLPHAATDETPPCVGEKMADVARDHFQATGEDHDD